MVMADDDIMGKLPCFCSPPLVSEWKAGTAIF